MRLLAPQGEYCIPGIVPIARDLEGQDRIARLMELLPGLRATVLRWGARGSTRFIESVFSATLAGKPLHWHAVARGRLEEGGAGELRMFLDTFPIASRIGRSRRDRQRWRARGLLEESS
jgi:hypothetical protein